MLTGFGCAVPACVWSANSACSMCHMAVLLTPGSLLSPQHLSGSSQWSSEVVLRRLVAALLVCFLQQCAKYAKASSCARSEAVAPWEQTLLSVHFMTCSREVGICPKGRSHPELPLNVWKAHPFAKA